MLKTDIRAILSNRWVILISVLLSLSFIILSKMEYETYLQIVYLLIPLGIIPIASSSISSEREHGFIDYIFSTPVTEREYILSKWLLWVSMGVVYILLTLPVSLCHLIFIGKIFLMPLLSYILMSILVFSLLSAFSLFISLLCVNDSRLSTIIGFIFAMLFYLAFFALPSAAFWGNAGSVLLYHLSPPVIAGDLLNIWHFEQMYIRYEILPSSPILSLMGALLLLLLLIFLSYKLFKDFQNKETFDSRRKTITAIALAFLILLPLPLSNTHYEIGDKEDLSGRGLSDNIISIKPFPTKLTYDGKPIESKLILELNVPEVHNLSISFSSEELRIKPEKVDVSYIVPEWDGKIRSFELPITIEPTKVKGVVEATYSYSVYVSSDEAKGNLERDLLTIKNNGASEASIAFSALSSLLAVLIFYLEYRKKFFRGKP